MGWRKDGIGFKLAGVWLKCHQIPIRVVATELREHRLDAGDLACGESVAPVEHAPIGVKYDRLQKPALFDVRRKLPDTLQIAAEPASVSLTTVGSSVQREQDLAGRGTADQAHCPPLRDQREDERASQGRGHAKDAGAHYFPPCADGAQSWAFQRRQ